MTSGWRARRARARGRPLDACSACGATPAPCTWRVLDESAGDIAVVTPRMPATAAIPSVGALHPPAIRLERAIRDLYGLEPVGLPDARPWLDHGGWGVRQPLGARADKRRADARPIAFLPAEGESLHQIPVGPVHAGIIEPGHFRFTANGETVVRLEAAPRLCPQGHRGADGGRDARHARRGSPAAPPATARSPMRSPSRARSRRRSDIEVPPRAV